MAVQLKLSCHSGWKHLSVSDEQALDAAVLVAALYFFLLNNVFLFV